MTSCLLKKVNCVSNMGCESSLLHTETYTPKYGNKPYSITKFLKEIVLLR